MPNHINHSPRIINKPWGSETWWWLDGHFCTKTISINAGTRTSFQYHVEKEEINFIRAGEAEVWLDDAEGKLQVHHLRAGDSFFVPKGKKHRVIALTGVEMFEVSTPQVDDVVRINDEYGRGDGKIQAEHTTPAVLILAAGMGSRLGRLTENKNKALIPIGNRAIISHIIESFPQDYDIVVALGHQKDSLREYLVLAHPERKFIFVEVDRWSDPKTDPGYTIYCCRAHLQRPFYLVANDCLIDSVPHIDGNWIGISPTSYPEKYATVDAQGDQVLQVVDKARDGQATGFEHAFIGIAAILNYEVYWRELESANCSIIGAWRNVSAYPTLKPKTLPWQDTGNLDDLRAARLRFGDQTLASSKDLEEITYKTGGRVLKYHPDPLVSENRLKSGRRLDRYGLAPEGLTGSRHFIAYNWQPGKNLYQHDSLPLYRAFLETLTDLIRLNCTPRPAGMYRSFYLGKTSSRMKRLCAKYPHLKLHYKYTVNDRHCRPLSTLLAFAETYNAPAGFYQQLHGDLHWDNVIAASNQEFTYVDWRDSFADSTEGGDVYYDLAKLYCGCIVPMELLKEDDAPYLHEGQMVVSYDYRISESLREIVAGYPIFLDRLGADPIWVNLLAGVSLLNIAPLHTEKWGKVLFYRGLELLDQTVPQ